MSHPSDLPITIDLDPDSGPLLESRQCLRAERWTTCAAPIGLAGGSWSAGTISTPTRHACQRPQLNFRCFKEEPC